MFSENDSNPQHSELVSLLRGHLESVDVGCSGMVTADQFISALKAAKVESVSSRGMKKIFALNTNDGAMKINLFMARFTETDPLSLSLDRLPLDTDELILGTFDGVVKRRKKKKKKKKKKMRKKQQPEYIQVISAKELESETMDAVEPLDLLNDENGFERLQVICFVLSASSKLSHGAMMSVAK